MLNNRMLKKLDFTLITVVLGLIGISLIIIGSATHINTPSDDRYWYVQRQGIFAVLNCCLIYFMLISIIKAYKNMVIIYTLLILLC